MKAFRRVKGPVIPLDRVDVDTDQIIPKQFLKRVERTGYGDFLFFDWRYGDDGSPDPDFVLNRPELEGAPILLAGPNFGCGSSREHAAWALMDFGIRVVIAPSFADIFQENAFQNGLLPVTLPQDEVLALMNLVQDRPGVHAEVDLEACTVEAGDGFRNRFQVDPFRRRCLLEGLDEIGLTLQHEDAIRRFEAQVSGGGGGNSPGSAPPH